MTSIIQKSKKNAKNMGYSSVLIKLLQGFVVSDEKRYWETLLTYQDPIREYFSVLGLQLHLSADDGYAFLKPGILSRESSNADGLPGEEGEALEEGSPEDSTISKELDGNIPSLVRRAPLSFEVSLLCILLRESLEHFDSTVSDDHRLILKRNDIYELLRLFYAEKTDETKQVRRFDSLINRVIELGFLRELKGNQNSFEVRRIIKAQFDAEKLSEIKAQMHTELGLHSLDTDSVESQSREK
jgi:hypothetical protein